MIYVSNGTKTITYPTIKAFKDGKHFKPDSVFREIDKPTTILPSGSKIKLGFDIMPYSEDGSLYYTKGDKRDAHLNGELDSNTYYKYEKPPAYSVVILKLADKVAVMVKKFFRDDKDGFTFEPLFNRAVLKTFRDKYGVKYNQKEKLLGDQGKEKASIPVTREEIDLDGVKLHLWTLKLSDGQLIPYEIFDSVFINLNTFKKGEEEDLVKHCNLVPAISERIAKEILDRKETL